ncbi:thioesterase family protein [Nocardioides sp. BP30]|uniref:acyl-CoA thioesterase n=1 Tax=Nocardioides sp. BP30 TaxID=3036374 RepID=UPI0024688530|nr:acyl-CoA thioesterase domain-containing protein [Nocardioides sp. BP30]WGL54021.1 thioesterase family protein [Nocardioides sp. BP30]
MIDLAELLTLETIDADIYRANAVFDERYDLYGGQVAAQALLAAGMTAPDGRLPHSLHGYFLRAGSAGRPTVFKVVNDRDGRSFSARRVVALQRGEVIFNAAVSFQAPPTSAMEEQLDPAPAVPSAEDCGPLELHRLLSFEGRRVPQPEYHARSDGSFWPTRFWARCTDPGLSNDPLVDAAVLTYLSDIYSGLSPFAKNGWIPGSSLDHAIWFHRPQVTGDWLLSEYRPIGVAGGRGLYTGCLYDTSGRVVASIAQETLFRRKREA